MICKRKGEFDREHATKGWCTWCREGISETVLLSQNESRKIQLSNAQPLADELKDGGHIQAEPCCEKYAQLSDAGLL